MPEQCRAKKLGWATVKAAKYIRIVVNNADIPEKLITTENVGIGSFQVENDKGFYEKKKKRKEKRTN